MRKNSLCVLEGCLLWHKGVLSLCCSFCSNDLVISLPNLPTKDMVFPSSCCYFHANRVPNIIFGMPISSVLNGGLMRYLFYYLGCYQILKRRPLCFLYGMVPTKKLFSYAKGFKWYIFNFSKYCLQLHNHLSALLHSLRVWGHSKVL